MAISLPVILNGERAVVVSFIGFVLFSLPLSLLLHGIVLSLLSLFGLYVEILADSSSSLSLFKTRPGASSGVLLGSVTLPSVMLSKMIQLLRAFSDNEIELQELNYQGMQFWATSASCFGVLIFLHLTMRYPTVHTCSSKQIAWGIITFIVLCAAMLFLNNIAILSTLNLLWMLFHGLVAVKLVQHLLNSFPSCASIGETLLVASGLVLYIGNMVVPTIAKLRGFMVLVPLTYGIRRSEISIIIQGVLLGLLLLPMIFKFVLHICSHFTSTVNYEAAKNSERRKTLIFVVLFGFTMLVFSPSWMQLVCNFNVHPLLWVVMFVLSEPDKRLLLCIYWVCLISMSVLRFYQTSKNSKTERILLRKYYHLLAVCMFVPAVIYQPKFLNLAFGVALAVFLTLEIIRVWRIWPLGQVVHQFMNAFTDHRDSDLLIVSHFSLLLGCALPIWMSSGYNDRPLAPFAGILSLGIGDTMASVVGYKYGVLRWSKTGKKTIEGTAAGIMAVLVACSVLLPLLASTGYILSQHWVSLLLAVIISGLLEAYTAQLDNAFIPLIFYSLLCL